MGRDEALRQYGGLKGDSEPQREAWDRTADGEVVRVSVAMSFAVPTRSENEL